jgi:Large polyvalent protein associated domain 29
MFNLQTKENRLKSQEFQFNSLINSGYTREDYKGLKIFTKNDVKYFTLKVFKDEASHHIQYMNYPSEERRAQAIQGYKEGYDRQKAYKAEQKKNKTLSTAANTAKAIREELKANFAGVKFSVTSENFAGGNSVNILWSDGPTTEQVSNISNKYQYGHFNGMDDIYEYTNDRNDIPQAKYVSESRSMSDEIGLILLPIAEQIYKDQQSERNEYPYNCRDANQFLYKIFYHNQIPTGATITGIIPTGEACGLASPEVFYKIGYTLAETAQKDEIKESETNEPQAQGEDLKAGSIQIVDYSEKSIAVIGETKPIKDILSNLGGKFNPRLSCGIGWIFPKTKSEAVIKKLKEIAEAKKQSEDNRETPVIVTAQHIEDARNYTLAIEAPKEEETTLQDEIQNTVNFFAETDRKIYGEVQPQTLEIATVQKCNIEVWEHNGRDVTNIFYPQNEVKEYDNLQDIARAAESGEMISILNLCKLVNQ